MNPIIKRRLKYFTDRKAELLQMKKADRGNELKQLNETISRLKRWQRELDAKKRTVIVYCPPSRGRTEGRTRNKRAEAVQRFQKACETSINMNKELSYKPAVSNI